jgi:hypothetical protein
MTPRVQVGEADGDLDGAPENEVSVEVQVLAPKKAEDTSVALSPLEQLR